MFSTRKKTYCHYSHPIYPSVCICTLLSHFKKWTSQMWQQVRSLIGNVLFEMSWQACPWDTQEEKCFLTKKPTRLRGDQRPRVHAHINSRAIQSRLCCFFNRKRIPSNPISFWKSRLPIQRKVGVSFPCVRLFRRSTLNLAFINIFTRMEEKEKPQSISQLH